MKKDTLPIYAMTVKQLQEACEREGAMSRLKAIHGKKGLPVKLDYVVALTEHRVGSQSESK